MKRYVCVTLFLAWSIAAVGLSCGGSSDEPDDMSVPSVCAFYAERDCGGFERCEGSFIKGFYNDVATCRDRVERSCESRLTANGTNETPDRVVACAKAIAGMSCDNFLDFDRWPDACFSPAGKLADGAGCVSASQCQGRSCPIHEGERCGKCQTLSPPGGACTNQPECLNALPCVSGVCTPHSRLDEPCDMERWCADGLACRNVDASGSGTCQKLLPADSPCDPQDPGGEQCDYTLGYACDWTTRKCSIPTSTGDIGTRCSTSSECNFANYCNSEGTCRPKPREGERCLVGDADCIGPARCYQGVCVARDPAVCQ